MANTFKNSGTAIGTSQTVLYTAPASAGNAAVIHSLYLSNIDGSNSVDATVEVTVDGGTTYSTVLKTVPVPADSTLVLDKPINLEASDKIAITASASGDLEAFASILEIT